ncbi:MAG: nucleoside triphosphate pyrophosphohydrolase [Clostridia bacterium]|nr:nucleoside triphosphate pyrophosphohydrolase [Clostridia bacterium]
MDAKDVKKQILGTERHDMDSLLRIIACLRGEDGCPWDRVQTHKTIRGDLIEETYEVVEAIDNDDPELLREELGDLLLQVVFHARIEEEEGRFDFSDVVHHICEKLVRRHPHVFGEVRAENEDSALASWDAAKKEEKHRDGAKGTMKAVPPSLPSLMRAKKVAKAAIKDGYDFGGEEAVLDRAIAVLTALREGKIADGTDENDAFGDVLFALSAISAMKKTDFEEILNKKTARFIENYTNL